MYRYRLLIIICILLIIGVNLIFFYHKNIYIKPSAPICLSRLNNTVYGIEKLFYENKLGYINIPKSGSSTISQALQEQFNASTKLIFDETDISNNTFYFTFIRDPLERHFSAFSTISWACCWTNNIDQAIQYFTNYLFFNVNPPKQSKTCPHKATVNNIDPCQYNFIHAYNQYEFLLYPGKTISIPRPIHFIGLIESRNHDLNNIFKRFNLTISIDTLFKNIPVNIDQGDVKNAYKTWFFKEDNVNIRNKYCEYYSLDYKCLGFTLPEFCH